MSHLASIGRRARRSARRLASDRGGHVAVLFGITLLPLAGLVGAALDYNRAIEFRTFMHREVDNAALAIASADSPNSDAVLAALKTRVGDYFGSGSPMIRNVGVSTEWVGSALLTVRMNARLATTISSVLPASRRDVEIGVASSVKRKPAVWNWTLPTIKDLSYEAADYNRISVYCYDETRRGEAGKGRRLATLTAISDNAGTDFSRAAMPACEAGETLSYKLWNVRNSRTTPDNWRFRNGRSAETDYAMRRSVEYYGYYTDTVIDPNTRIAKQTVSGGREYSDGTMSSINVTSPAILETILCTTLVDCKAQSLGGLLPNDTNGAHDPAQATAACAETKSMYFGWEDRPPSAGGSDRDYNDIRIIVSCPKLVKVSDKEVRIVE